MTSLPFISKGVRLFCGRMNASWHWSCKPQNCQFIVFQSKIAFHIKTSHLVCTANFLYQMLPWSEMRYVNQTLTGNSKI